MWYACVASATTITEGVVSWRYLPYAMRASWPWSVKLPSGPCVPLKTIPPSCAIPVDDRLCRVLYGGLSTCLSTRYISFYSKWSCIDMDQGHEAVAFPLLWSLLRATWSAAAATLPLRTHVSPLRRANYRFVNGNFANTMNVATVENVHNGGGNIIPPLRDREVKDLMAKKCKHKFDAPPAPHLPLPRDDPRFVST